MRATTLLAAVIFVIAACRRPQDQPDGAPSPPPPPLPGVRVVDMIPASLSGETWQDAEPFLTTFASNPNILAASAFTPNPGGPASTTAPIYVSDDSGNTWSLRNTLPSNVQTADITHAGGESPALYATILSAPSIALKDLETNDVLSASTMTQDATRPDVDQPFVRAIRAASTDRLYVGINDFAAPNRAIVFSNEPTLGQERIGSTLSLAVDAAHSDTVYIAWADRARSGDTGDIQTVHVRRSLDRGATWSNDLRTLPNTTNPSLAVADDGTVGLLYQQLTGTGNASRWVNRFEQSRDGFATHKDLVLATAPANTPAFQFLPYLGDYNMLLTRGNEFLGIFSAANTPDPANFPSGVAFQRRVNQATHQLLDGSGAPVDVSIDPFFFSVPVMP